MEEKQTFKSVKEFIEHLENLGHEKVHTSFVIETLTALSQKPAKGLRRGQLAGLTVEEMTDEQLKREIINSKSVLYKAQQRGASVETIDANQARVDKAMAEKAKRTPVVEAAPDAEVTDVEGSDTDATVYNDTLEDEI